MKPEINWDAVRYAHATSIRVGYATAIMLGIMIGSIACDHWILACINAAGSVLGLYHWFTYRHYVDWAQQEIEEENGR